MIERISSTPKVSVIIPLYNKAPYIKRALDSVLVQSVQDFEIVVVNDGSTDGGEKIVEELSDSRIRLINQKNQGVSAARNNGVNVAKADFVAFLDADDMWFPEFLETILKLREKYPNGGVYSTACNELTKKKRLVSIEQKGLPKDFEGVVPSIFRFAAINDGFPGCTSAVSIPKSIFIQSKGFQKKYRLGEDVDLLGRISLSNPWIHTSKKLAIYCHDDVNSAVRNPELVSINEHPFLQSFNTIYSRKERETFLKTIPDLNLYLDSLYLWRATNLITLGKKKEAMAELRKVTHNDLHSKKKKVYLRMLIPCFMLPFARVVWNKFMHLVS